jgi:acyl carrier protein
VTEDGDLPFYALVELITVIEERFGFEMDAEDITVEVFESVGSLSTSVAEHRS